MKQNGLKLKLRNIIILMVGIVPGFLSLVSCSDGDKDGTHISRGARDRQTFRSGDGLNIADSVFTGTIFDELAASDFRDTVALFLSGSDDPEDILGDISGEWGDDTGLRFRAVVNLEGGRIGEDEPIESFISKSGSFLDLLIWDSIAEETGDVLIPRLELSEGHMSRSGRVTLIFGDAFGTLKLVGEIYDGYFEGTISFENLNTHGEDESVSGARGVLGQFSIPTCDIFDCY